MPRQPAFDKRETALDFTETNATIRFVSIHMRDYKRRGTDLQFRKRRGNRLGRLAVIATLLALATVGVHVGRDWFGTGQADQIPAVKGRAATAGNAIPLALPPAPPGYGSDVGSEAVAADGQSAH